ncbi:MAG: sigma-70 family RNA polymerase sigma factor [Proteobacteria bacterium]|nr:sigma-70 family RNA polymerase sigma factor [Pseudomonadota bacterium]
MTDLTEIDHLIARCGLGDRRAFAALYGATSAKLFGLAVRILGNRAEAEDAVQDIYVRIWQNAARYRAEGLSPWAWLLTIGRNACIDRLRARRATQPLDEAAELADLAPGPEETALASAEARRIAGCLATLPPERAEAVRRAYLEGETYDELAHRFGVPLNTMRTWLRRSLMKLRECLSA